MAVPQQKCDKSSVVCKRLVARGAVRSPFSVTVVAWHTLFDELSISPETVGAHRRAPDSIARFNGKI
ncbi:MAG: hypothetical protein RIG66_13010 [Coleofasciculus sp. E2-BRE-01]